MFPTTKVRRSVGVIALVLVSASVVVGLPVASGAAAPGGTIAVVSLNANRSQSSIELIPSTRIATPSDSTLVVRDPGEISDLQWTPDGKTLVYEDYVDESSGGPNHVYALDVASRRQRLLVADLGLAGTESLSRDGKTVAYTQGVGDLLAYVVPINGGPRHKLGLGENPAWSPDSSRIAFDVTGLTTDRVFTVAADGSKKTPLYTSATSVESIAWSPDGKSLMLETNEPAKAAAGLAGSSQLETISRSGAVLHVLSTATDFQGSFSPDGTRVALEQAPSSGSGSPSFVVENADGTDRHTIDTGLVDGSFSAFAWSRDGGTIVTAEESQGIRVSRVDGSHAQLIDPPVGGDRLGYPAWRPKS